MARTDPPTSATRSPARTASPSPTSGRRRTPTRPNASFATGRPARIPGTRHAIAPRPVSASGTSAASGGSPSARSSASALVTATRTSVRSRPSSAIEPDVVDEPRLPDPRGHERTSGTFDLPDLLEQLVADDRGVVQLRQRLGLHDLGHPGGEGLRVPLPPVHQ